MITVLGSINLDLIGQVARFPAPGETVAGTGFTSSPGGKGANQALAARRAGSEVRLVGAVGDGQMGTAALEFLAADGVDLASVHHLDGPQGTAMIMVDQRGENIIGIFPGANARLTDQDADVAVRSMGHADILILQQEVPQAATTRALELARSRNIRSILNIAPFLETTPLVAKSADILIANESEFALLAGQQPKNWDSALDQWARSHKQTILVTLGANGAIAASPDAVVHIPALEIEAIDTVGAGDTFVGYFASGLDLGRGLTEAMRQGAVAASLACTRVGAQPSIPWANAVANSWDAVK